MSSTLPHHEHVETTRVAAAEYLSLGWNTIPAGYKSKAPRGRWARYQVERVTEADLLATLDGQKWNLFIVCGSISRLVVLDCDTTDAVRHWRAVLGPVLDETACVKTASGFHFYFELPEGLIVRTTPAENEHWEIRAEGAGVIAPPSGHKSGVRYEWIRGPEHVQPAPPQLIERTNQVSRRSSDFEDETWTVGVGFRSNALASIAGTLRQHLALTADEIEQMLLILMDRFERGEEDEPMETHIAKVARSIAQYPPGKVPWEYRTGKRDNAGIRVKRRARRER